MDDLSNLYSQMSEMELVFQRRKFRTSAELFESCFDNKPDPSIFSIDMPTDSTKLIF